VTRNERITLIGAGVAAAVLFAAGSKMAPGGSVKYPKYQGAPAWPPFTPPPGVPDPSVHHVGPYDLVYTPHRYPAACGNDISVLIHRGYATMALPQQDDMTWMSAPPSEMGL
jgi:hypothetical protein